MAKNCGKPGPGQKGLTTEFATVQRQTRIPLDAAGGKQSAQQYEPFVPGPNAELVAFISRHGTAYSPADDEYEVSAFDHDLVVHKHNKLYTMHLYWSKKDPLGIAEYVEHYTKPGDLVLNPFAGSGTTGCGAQIVGRNAILIDVSASAGFLAHHYSMFVEPDVAEEAYATLLSDGRGAAVDELYATKCDRCNGPAITEFVIWSDTYQCPQCTEIVALYDCPEVSVSYPDGSTKKKRVCPHCLTKSQGTARPEFVISTRTKKFAPVPVGCKYTCRGACRPKSKLRLHNDTSKKTREHFEKYDLPGVTAVSVKSIRDWYPRRRMMDAPPEQEIWGVKWRSGSANYKVVADLYTSRNLLALAKLRSATTVSHEAFSPLLFLTWIIHKCSNLMGCGKDGVGRIGVGTYYMPPIRLESRPTKYLTQAKSQIRSHFEAKAGYSHPGKCCLSNEKNEEALGRIPPESIDYIFTDPPYLNAEVQYGELNFLWDAWLDLPTSLREEITLNPVQHHSWEEAETALRAAIAGSYRALKPGRWASICYHDTSEANWTMLQRAVLDAGFDIHTVTCFEPKSKSRKAITAEKIVKSDLVLNCRKPRFGDKERVIEELNHVSARVREILIEELQIVGWQTRDRLWNTTLKRLLTRGQMAAHRFDDILSEVAARSESGRWFLREEFEALSQGDIKNEEAAGNALLRFARLRCAGVPVNLAAQIALTFPRLAEGEIDEREVENHIKTKLIDDKALAQKFNLGGRMKGVEFYDCLFFYLTRFLKRHAAGQTPRRNLAEFLEEYLVRFKDGDKWLYRVPDSVEANALRKSRQTGLGRRIRQYVSHLRGEGEFPVEKRPDSKTLFAWLKHCANFGLAEEGVLLFEKGGMAGFLGQLPEEDRYDAEDYYAQCRRKAGKPADDDEEEGDSEDTDESDED